MVAVQPDLPETILARARHEMRRGGRDKAFQIIQSLPDLSRTDRRPTEMLRSFSLLGRGDSFLDRLGGAHPANSPRNREALREWLMGARGGEQSPALDKILSGGRYTASVKAELYSLAATELHRWNNLVAADPLLARAFQETGDLHLMVQRGTMLGQAGQPTEALLFLRAVDERIPAPAAEAYRKLVDQHGSEGGVLDSVRQRLEELTGTDPCRPDRAPLLQLLVGMQSRPESLADALRNQERLLKMRPDSPIILNNLAVLEAFVPERVDSGLRHIQEAIEQDRPRLEYLDTLALLQLQSGDLESGLNTLLGQLPLLAAPEHKLHLAIAMLRTGRTEHASRIAGELQSLLTAATPWSPLNGLLWQELSEGPSGQYRRHSRPTPLMQHDTTPASEGE
jgi:tetratricopeptide (TPR) repeat protein